MPHTSNTDTLKLTYFSYFHTVVKYEMCLGRGGGEEVKLSNSNNKYIVFIEESKLLEL
jgi:hypothetical protein